MLKITIRALLCAGVTFGATAASANDMNSIEAFELSNIEFLAATGANGYRFDRRDRRDEVKGIIEDRISMAKARRTEIKVAISTDGSLSTADKVLLWEEFAALKSRLGRLYTDRRGVLSWGVMDLEELEEFYAPAVSVS